VRELPVSAAYGRRGARYASVSPASTPADPLIRRKIIMSRTARDAQKRVYGHGTGVPHPVDVHVGKRIRMRRLFLDMNQETLANALGLTFQQVQKYEGGANRVSASRLSAVADILGVPISFFFSDLRLDDETETPAEQVSRERMERPETIELIRLYYAIPDGNVRYQFLLMVKAIVATKAAKSQSPLNDAAPTAVRRRMRL
jgi:transcriptional regulator with XRE-family HTH domain